MNVQIGDLIMLNNGYMEEPTRQPIFGILVNIWNDSIINSLRYSIMWLNIDWDDGRGLFEQTIYAYRTNYLIWREANLNA